MSEQQKTENAAPKKPGAASDSRQAFGTAREDAAQAKKDAETAKFIAAMPMRIRAFMI